MAMPASGSPISFSQMQTEFGGSNPIGFNEYYRDGSYVPSELFKEYAYSADVYSVSHRIQSGAADEWEWHSDSVLRSTSGPTHGPVGALDQVFVSGVYYRRGTGPISPNTTGTSKVDGVTGVPFTIYHYSIQIQEDVNATVPTSGTISLSQFYGTFKTF